MGTLVFQATLGGTVNLIGPNIAGTVNFTLPSADGTSGQALATNGSGTLAFSSFATLVSNTFTGSQTLSAGTANGVTYLNGSKVVTSGSALVFDGTNLGVLAGSVTTPAAKIHAVGYIRASNGAGTLYSSLASDGVYSSGTDLYLSSPAGYASIFYANNTEGMRLTSTGLGIGTSSPAYKLDVVTTTAAGLRVATSTSAASTASLYLAVANNFSGTSQAYIQCIGSGVSGVSQLAFATARAASDTTATEAMRIDSSGNLLVGTTSVAASNSRLSLAGSVNWGVGPQPAGSTFYIYNASNVGVYLTDGANTWASSSDERKKDIIEPITDAANKITQLRAVIGKYKTDAEGTRRSFLIAQDLQSVLPEAVDSSEVDSLGVRYTDVIPLLVAAIKEQTTFIQSLKARLDAANL